MAKLIAHGKKVTATLGEFTFGLLPQSEQNASGCLVEMEDNEPAQKGPLVYLSVEGE